jgi:hypothetical protein
MRIMPLETKPSKAAESRRKRDSLFSLIESLETRQLLSSVTSVALPSIQVIPDASTGSIAGYSPAQIRTAYGFNSVTDDGAGQTIAIVDAYSDPDISSDLATFDKEFSLPTASLKVVSETGSTTALPAANAGWDLEQSLDVEWAHAIAPDANILLVETNSSGLGDLLTGVNYARNAAGVSVVSMSWGAGEFSSETAYDSYFTTPTGHQGVTFVAASGDEGSWYGPEWPATSPNVLSVGGTTLNTSNSSGTYSSETGWSGSTGGISDYEREPAYQEIAQDTGAKTTPDVSYDANPSTGFAVYDSVSYDGLKGWSEVGGTSAGAPQWAALVALADQGRVAKGLGTLNGASQTLPLLYSLYNTTQYSQGYHDVTSGSSGYYSAGLYYDAVTGLGTPKAAYVVQELIGATSTGAQAGVVTTVSTTTTTNSRARGAREAVTMPSPVPVAVNAPSSQSSDAQSVSVAVGSIKTSDQVSDLVDVGSITSAAGQADQTAFGHSTAAAGTTTAVNPSQAAYTELVNPRAVAALGEYLVTRVTGVVENFSTSLAVPGLTWEIEARNGLSNIPREISQAAGASAAMVETLLVADASAMANIANTIAARLSDENFMIWKDAAGLVGAAIIVGTYSFRPRREGQVALKEGKKPKYLCVGE